MNPKLCALESLTSRFSAPPGQKILGVLSTALGALTEQGFTVKDVRYHCHDFEMEIDLSIELVVDCSFEQAFELRRNVIEAIASRHENPLTDLIQLRVDSLSEDHNSNDQP